MVSTGGLTLGGAVAVDDGRDSDLEEKGICTTSRGGLFGMDIEVGIVDTELLCKVILL